MKSVISGMRMSMVDADMVKLFVNNSNSLNINLVVTPMNTFFLSPQETEVSHSKKSFISGIGMSMVDADMVKLFINNSNSLNSNLVVLIRDNNSRN